MFYDTYDFSTALSSSFNSADVYHTHYCNVVSQKTGDLAYYSDNQNKYNIGVNYYDSKNWLIQSYETHIKSSSNVGEPILKNYEYNFSGEKIKEKTNAPFAIGIVNTLETYTRDHIGRIANIYQYVNKLYNLVTVHIQNLEKGVCFIGQIHDIDSSSVVIHELGTKSTLDRKYILLSLDDITRVDAGGQYENNLKKLFKI